MKNDELTPLPIEKAYEQNFITIEDLRRIFMCGVNTATAIMKVCKQLAKQHCPLYVDIKGKIFPADLRRYVNGETAKEA